MQNFLQLSDHPIENNNLKILITKKKKHGQNKVATTKSDTFQYTSIWHKDQVKLCLLKKIIRLYITESSV